MKRFIPSPAMIVALAALLVALSGSAYAALKIGTNNIKNGAVTTAKIKNGAINTNKLANSSVGSNKLSPGAVSASAIANGAVSASALANGAVSSSAIANGAIGTLSLANSAVSSEKLADSAVTSSKIANSAVSTNKLAPGAANPTAYGEISSAGALNIDNPSRNLASANIYSPSAGVFCIEGLSFTPASMMVTPSNRDAQNDTLASAFYSPLGVTDCNNGAVRVRTYDISNTALINRSFWIWIIEDN